MQDSAGFSNMKQKIRIADLSKEIQISKDKSVSPPVISPVKDKNQTFGPARVLFLGSGRAGKTSIIRRFLHNRFSENYNPTVEDIHPAKFIVRNKLVTVEFMDTSGSFQFPVMLRLCITKATAFVIVFSNDSVDSLKEAGNLLEQIKSIRKDYAPYGSISSRQHVERFNNGDGLENTNDYFTSSPPVVIVCNKSDISPADEQVTEGAIMEWLITRGMKPSQFVYASAKENESISSIFESLWQQNEITHAITFESWEPKRRYSTSSNGDKDNNNGGSSQNNETENSNKSRGGIFRNSLRLSRRTSTKSQRNKAEIVKLECNIS